MEGMQTIRMNSRGQVVLPARFRRKLSLREGSEMQIRLLEDGAMEIRPVVVVPISSYLENNPEIRDEVLKSYEAAAAGDVLDEDETRRILEGETDL